MFAQTYSLEKGLSKFKERGKRAAVKEISQLVNRIIFQPIKLEHLTNFTREAKSNE